MRVSILIPFVSMLAIVIASAQELEFGDDAALAEAYAKAKPMTATRTDIGPNGERLIYEAESDALFTGWIKSTHHGEVTLAHWKNGKMDGLATEWYENGKMSK